MRIERRRRFCSCQSHKIQQFSTLSFSYNLSPDDYALCFPAGPATGSAHYKSARLAHRPLVIYVGSDEFFDHTGENVQVGKTKMN